MTDPLLQRLFQRLIIYFFQIVALLATITFTLGGHSTLDPPLPIPNRVVKRSRADDSVHSHVKVGHRQASY